MSWNNLVSRSTEVLIKTKQQIASTTTRDGTTRITSGGSQPWRFEVLMPDGPEFDSYRSLISEWENYYNTGSSQTLQLSGNIDYLTAYQGDMSGTMTGSWTQGATTITVSGGTGSGYRFKAGDLIQLGSGSVYRVTADVVSGSTSVNIHRPVRDSSGSGTVIRGSSVTWQVVCSNFPNYRIFGYNQLAWDGPVILVEDIA
jgi:hypothetical protein